MTEPAAYVEILEMSYPLMESVHGAAIEALELAPGSRGLDAGCGIGLQALKLADAVGPGGHVTGLDLAPEHVARARELVERAGLSERISFQEGDVRNLPFDDDGFDWAWSADCVGYGPQLEGLRSLEELARVVKPGGSVAILAWTSQMLLPGYPLLEARLNATSSGLAPYVPGEYRPEWHFPRALGWFRELGLEELSAQTFAGDVHAPLSEGLRGAMAALFAMRWFEVEPELAPEDWAEYQRLCLPESPEFIVDHPDYYAFFTYSMFRGRVV
jgi:demethylmenaquinone methyltransferase/2-methoxy-6-polyprenyl-1,4-benzoquinol methylase